MTDDLGDDGVMSRSKFAVESFEEVQCGCDKLPSPSFVPETMVPEFLARKWGDGVRCIAHEAAGGVGVEGQHEGNEEMMCVPEGLKCLLSNAMVRGCIDQHHAEKHDMPRDATRSGKVNLDSQLVANVIHLNVVEAETVSKVKKQLIKWLHSLDIMSRNVNSRKDQQGICDLAMEPCRFIEW